MQALDCYFVPLPGHDSNSADVASKLAEENEGQAAPQTVVVVRTVFAEDGSPPLDLETVREAYLETDLVKWESLFDEPAPTNESHPRPILPAADVQNVPGRLRRCQGLHHSQRGDAALRRFPKRWRKARPEEGPRGRCAKVRSCSR